MAYGELSSDKEKQIYFGQPLIDAFKLEEKLQYYGIIVHHTLVKYMEEKKDKIQTYDDLFYERETPLKTGMISHTNLNWFSFLNTDDKNSDERTIRNLINIFKTKTSGTPRKYIDNTITMFEKCNKIIPK